MKNLYLIALTPPRDLSEEIDRIRKELSTKYNCYAALKPPVHLTLRESFTLAPHDEVKLIRTLKSAACNHKPFTQILNNFDKFSHHTIYIKANKPPELAGLKKQLTKNLNNHFSYLPATSGTFNPHVTVAYRDIPEQNFEPAFEEYKQTPFYAEYFCEEFVLFKHDTKNWKILESFKLRGFTQLTLFI
jgi:2'-5' RNA ligase